MKIYVASSWRNEKQTEVVKALREAGHSVYDFKNDTGFQWSDIDPDWLDWDSPKFRESLRHPLAVRGFKSDMDAMKWCDAVVLVLPCGRSAHSEAGWCAGAKKKSVVLLSGKDEPELMYKLFDFICVSMDEVIQVLEKPNICHYCKKPLEHPYTCCTSCADEHGP